MGVGSIPLWPLGLLQQLLGLVSSQSILSETQLVASRLSRLRGRFLVWQSNLLVPSFVSSSRSAFA
jgi:hypothetical protein